jgi:hypothetical protein
MNFKVYSRHQLGLLLNEFVLYFFPAKSKWKRNMVYIFKGFKRAGTLQPSWHNSPKPSLDVRHPNANPM